MAVRVSSRMRLGRRVQIEARKKGDVNISSSDLSHVIPAFSARSKLDFIAQQRIATTNNRPASPSTTSQPHPLYPQIHKLAINPLYTHINPPNPQLHKHASSPARTQKGTKESTPSNPPAPNPKPSQDLQELTRIPPNTVPRQARRSATKRLAQSHGHPARLRRLPEHCAGRSDREPAQQRKSPPGNVRDPRQRRRHAGSAGPH